MEHNKTGGFTLIELLVVVLIIGILAAVALPQYQKAVTKTRYATLKNLTHSIANAEQVYFLENGKYTTSFEELGIEVGEDKYSMVQQRYFPWGFCSLSGAREESGDDRRIYCHNETIEMGYLIRLTTGKRSCIIYKDSTMLSSICKQETNGSTPTGSGDYQEFTYP